MLRIALLISHGLISNVVIVVENKKFLLTKRPWELIKVIHTNAHPHTTYATISFRKKRDILDYIFE